MKQIYKIPDGQGGFVEVNEADFKRWKQRKQKRGYQVFIFTRFREIVEAKEVPDRLRQQAADLMWDEMGVAEKAGNLPGVVVFYNPDAEVARGFFTGQYHC